MNYRHTLQTSILYNSIRQEQESCQTTMDRDGQYMEQLNQDNKALLHDLQMTRDSFTNVHGLDRLQFESHLNTSHVEITSLHQQLNETIYKIGSYQKQIHHLMEVGKEQKYTISELKEMNERLRNQVQELTIEQVEARHVDENSKSNIKGLTRSNDELRQDIEQLKVQLQTQEEEALSSWNTVKEANEKLQKQVQELTIEQVEGRLVDEMNKANIGDLTRWNEELRKSMEQLRVQMQAQEQEAVSALNAVAMSATVRKVRQVQDVMADNQDKMDSVVKTAVEAMNTVAASNVPARKSKK